MGKKTRNKSRFPLILTTILILSFILLIIFSLFFNNRLNLADLFYSPAGSGSYSSTASGLGFGSGSGSGEKCCLCEYQSGLSESILFKEECDTWNKNHLECNPAIIQPESNDIYSCYILSSKPNCIGKDFLYQYFGHSEPKLGRYFIDKTILACFNCPSVKGVISGCSSFENSEALSKYLNSFILTEGVQFELTGAQCPILFGDSQGFCSGSPTSCTLSYSCNPKYGPCPLGICSNLAKKIKCTDSGGNIIDKYCCSKLNALGFWREGGCNVGMHTECALSRFYNAGPVCMTIPGSGKDTCTSANDCPCDGIIAKGIRYEDNCFCLWNLIDKPIYQFPEGCVCKSANMIYDKSKGCLCDVKSQWDSTKRDCVCKRGYVPNPNSGICEPIVNADCKSYEDCVSYYDTHQGLSTSCLSGCVNGKCVPREVCYGCYNGKTEKAGVCGNQITGVKNGWCEERLASGGVCGSGASGSSSENVISASGSNTIEYVPALSSWIKNLLGSLT